MTNDEQTRQLEFYRQRWLNLRKESELVGKVGYDVEAQDFSFLQSNGGEITETNVPYIDNCYMHRLTLTTRSGEFFNFKMLTTSEVDLYPPF